MNGHPSIRLIQLLLVTFNFIIVLTGISMIVIGTTINAVYSDISFFLESKFFSPAAFFVVIGFLVFGVAFLGCCGAFKQSVFMINMFSLCLVILFTLEISAAVSGYCMIDIINSYIKDSLNTTFNDYGSSEGHKIVDFIQREMACCGIINVTDWLNINVPSTSLTSCSDFIPYSCYYTNATTMDTCNLYDIGCYQRLGFIVQANQTILIITALGLAGAQVAGIILSYSLGRSLRVQKTLRELRRTQVRHRLFSNIEEYTILKNKQCNDMEKKEEIQ